MHNVNYIQILMAYLRHVAVQVYPLQEEQNAGFKKQPPMISCCKFRQSEAAPLLMSIVNKW